MCHSGYVYCIICIKILENDAKVTTYENNPLKGWWSGPDRVVIEPNTTKPIEYVYKPQVMTQPNRKHTVCVFIY